MTNEERFDQLATMVCNMTTRGLVYEKAVEELTELWEVLINERDN